MNVNQLPINVLETLKTAVEGRLVAVRIKRKLVVTVALAWPVTGCQPCDSCALNCYCKRRRSNANICFYRAANMFERLYFPEVQRVKAFVGHEVIRIPGRAIKSYRVKQEFNGNPTIEVEAILASIAIDGEKRILNVQFLTDSKSQIIEAPFMSITYRRPLNSYQPGMKGGRYHDDD